MNRFAWRKLHVDNDVLTLESRLGSELVCIPRAVAEGEDAKVSGMAHTENGFSSFCIR